MADSQTTRIVPGSRSVKSTLASDAGRTVLLASSSGVPSKEPGRSRYADTKIAPLGSSLGNERATFRLPPPVRKTSPRSTVAKGAETENVTRRRPRPAASTKTSHDPAGKDE